MAAKAKIDIELGNGQIAGKTINELRQKANRLTKEINNLSPGTDKFVKKSAELQKVGKRLKKVRSEVKGVESSLSKAGGFFKKFGAQFVAAFSVGAILAGLKAAFNKIKEFQQANANLAAVLGKTRSSILALSAQAMRLGAITSFSATQVTELQIALARLGFSEAELKKITAPVLRLAEAAGTDLANAATIAGATLRGFGLDASQMKRVVDVMAKSFSSSSLDIEKFKIAMAAVAPVAKNAGVDIERTTALLGVLTDRGLEASTAGTSLRNMFLKLSEKGLTWNEAMEKINTATDKNAEALKLFGTRGATSAVILAENADAASLLEEKLDNSAGAAERMATEQLATLGGALKLLASAWEGFILSLENGNGFISKFLNSTIGIFTSALGALTSEIKEESQVTSDLQVEMNLLMEVLQRGELSYANRQRVIEEINSKYGQYLPNLLTEKSTVEEIKIAQDAANDSFNKKITLLIAEEHFLEIQKKRFTAELEALELQKKLISSQKSLTRAQSLYADSQNSDFIPAMQVAARGVALMNDNISDNIIIQDELTKEWETAIEVANSLGLSIDDLNKKLSPDTGDEDPVIRDVADQVTDLLPPELLPPELLAQLDSEGLLTDLINAQLLKREDFQQQSIDRLAAKQEAHGEKQMSDAKKIATFKENLAIQELQLAGQVTSFLGRHLAKRAKNEEDAKLIEKTAALIGIAINLQKEMALNALAAAANPLNAISAGAAGAVQLGKSNFASILRAGIGTARVLSFQDGGLLHGPRHSQMGIPAVVRSTGQQIEMEGGEFVFSRKAVEGLGAHYLSDINSRFETGGPINPLTPSNAPSAAVTDSSAASSSDQVHATFKEYADRIDLWATSLQVHNNVIDTNAGIQVINSLEEESDF